MKPKIFIGSSVEGVKIANAIQAHLDSSCETTVWKDGIFMLSQNTLESLERALDNVEYGIFVFSPDDILFIHDEEKKAIRDNVLFELGLFMGKLGRNNVFFITPEKCEELHLPTDLLGINRGVYFEREDGNMRAAVNTFCDEVREQIFNMHKTNYGVLKFGLFQDFSYDINQALAKSRCVSLFFIHSRSWRENNHNSIVDFLEKGESKKMYVFLPDFLNESLMMKFKENFSDGKVIPSLIEDATSFFLKLQERYPNKVDILLYDFYPTYSFYMFDKISIIALYPTTDKKKNVPTFMISNNSEYYEFVLDDKMRLISESIKLTDQHLDKIKEA